MEPCDLSFDSASKFSENVDYDDFTTYETPNATIRRKRMSKSSCSASVTPVRKLLYDSFLLNTPKSPQNNRQITSKELIKSISKNTPTNKVQMERFKNVKVHAKDDEKLTLMLPKAIASDSDSDDDDPLFARTRTPNTLLVKNVYEKE